MKNLKIFQQQSLSNSADFINLDIASNSFMSDAVLESSFSKKSKVLKSKFYPKGPPQRAKTLLKIQLPKLKIRFLNSKILFKTESSLPYHLSYIP